MKRSIALLLPFLIIISASLPAVQAQGLSWYGLDAGDPDWFRLNKVTFDRMTSQFPGTHLLVLPFSANRFSQYRLQILQDIVSWCGQKGIKVIISNYQIRGVTEYNLKKFWTRMAREFEGNRVVVGFDLFNEPWDSRTGWYGKLWELVNVYERVIDGIRVIDPERTCYVQSMFKHEQTLDWVRRRPVRRSNVGYIAHLYSNRWTDGKWYTWEGSHPWSKYYLRHSYYTAKTVLREGLYERFGFVKRELGLPVLITEVAFLGSSEGLRYGEDVLSILNEWGIPWTYHSYYSPTYRPMTLTDTKGNLKVQAGVVKSYME